MRLSWVTNGFICKELYAPFSVEKDNDYLGDLRQKYNVLLNQAEKAGADAESINIIKHYKKKVMEALHSYYSADIAKCNTIIKNLILDIGKDKLAVAELKNSLAFPGNREQEIQFFRCRIGDTSKSYSAKEMLHLPYSLRAKTGNYRFSIPGNPSFYLANSSYGCWIECGLPAESEFNVAPVVLDGTQVLFNLVVSISDLTKLNELDENRVHTWLKLIMLMIATSYKIKECDRSFKSEYIVSQSIMMACKKLKYDGVAYYSKRVTDEKFALCAINLALFVEYKGEYSDIVKHMKIDDSFNFALYKKLLTSLKYKDYKLRTLKTGLVTNIGSYARQYPYSETEFYEYDKFLFTTWRDRNDDRAKDKMQWGGNI